MEYLKTSMLIRMLKYACDIQGDDLLIDAVEVTKLFRKYGMTRKIVNDKYVGLEMNDDLKELLKNIEKKEYESLDLPLVTGNSYGWKRNFDVYKEEE